MASCSSIEFATLPVGKSPRRADQAISDTNQDKRTSKAQARAPGPPLPAHARRSQGAMILTYRRLAGPIRGRCLAGSTVPSRPVPPAVRLTSPGRVLSESQATGVGDPEETNASRLPSAYGPLLLFHRVQSRDLTGKLSPPQDRIYVTELHDRALRVRLATSGNSGARTAVAGTSRAGADLRVGITRGQAHGSRACRGRRSPRCACSLGESTRLYPAQTRRVARGGVELRLMVMFC